MLLIANSTSLEDSISYLAAMLSMSSDFVTVFLSTTAPVQNSITGSAFAP